MCANKMQHRFAKASLYKRYAVQGIKPIAITRYDNITTQMFTRNPMFWFRHFRLDYTVRGNDSKGIIWHLINPLSTYNIQTIVTEI